MLRTQIRLTSTCTPLVTYCNVIETDSQFRTSICKPYANSCHRTIDQGTCLITPLHAIYIFGTEIRRTTRVVWKWKRMLVIVLKLTSHYWSIKPHAILAHKQLWMHGWVINTVATDALVPKHRAISINSVILLTKYKFLTTGEWLHGFKVTFLSVASNNCTDVVYHNGFVSTITVTRTSIHYRSL